MFMLIRSFSEGTNLWSISYSHLIYVEYIFERMMWSNQLEKKIILIPSAYIIQLKSVRSRMLFFLLFQLLSFIPQGET